MGISIPFTPGLIPKEKTRLAQSLSNTIAKEFLNRAITSYNLSQRGINKTLKVGRTIADLRDSQIISKSDIMESVSYRMKR